MRICVSLLNFKNYCTSSDFGACPNTGKFNANPQSPHRMIRLPACNPQKKHVNRSSSTMVAKYKKLHRYSKRNFSSNKATSILRAVSAANSDCRFLGGRRHFASVAYANSITLPYCRSTPPPGRSFKSSKVGNLSSTPCHRYFSLRL